MNNKKQTRIQLIDQRLLKAGWNVLDKTQVVEEFAIIVAAEKDKVEISLAKLADEKEKLETLKDSIIKAIAELPFTLIHPQGITGVFSPAEIEEILVLTEKLMAA